MSLKTFSKFYYGYVVTAQSNTIDFQESAGVLLATLNIGSYSLTDFIAEIKRALDAAGTHTYTVSVSRTTRLITISTTSNFKLLTTSGTHLGNTAFTLIGLSGADHTGASTYTGSVASGSSFSPQFKLQDYIAPNDWQDSIQPTVNESSTGKLEIIKFGIRKFIQFNVMYSTDIAQAPNSPIKNNPTGVEDLESFMLYLVTRGPFEFMPNAADTSTFYTITCESTPDSSTGTGFKIKELYDKGLPGYFQTGDLKMRVG